MANILVVDDDEQICTVFAQFLSEQGHTPRIASNGEEALKSAVECRPDLVLMDIRMPRMDGIEALQRLREIAPETFVVIMTAYGTSQTSIEAMRLGAFDYLMKPLDLDVVRSVIDRALDSIAVSREVETDRRDAPQKYALVNLFGHSPPMQKAYKLIGVLAANDVPALLVGERGVGKHTVAKTIHFNSARKDGVFATIHCGSLPGEFLEAELFGRVTADSTAGGVPAAPGKLTAARGGTLFIDDVESLSLPLQARLASLLYERTLGGAEAPGSRTTTRVIAATEAGLEERVQQGTFNEKLFHILGTISIELPPLRRRLEDLPELVSHFIARCNDELGKALKGVGPRVTERLRSYTWPGNVAELESAIRRAAILTRGDVITLADIGDSLEESSFTRRVETRSDLEPVVRRVLRQRLADGDPGPDGSYFHEIVGEVERILVREALDVTSGNQLRAAELLGLNRTTLRKKMDR